MKNRTDEIVNIYRVRQSQVDVIGSGVIVEKPVSLSVNGNIWLTFMCTPVDLEALAVGFLYNEGIIDSKDDLRFIELHPDKQMVEVWLSKRVEKPENWRITSGCTGGVTAVDENVVIKQNQDGYTLPSVEVTALCKKLFENQGLYHRVRGVHASALSDGKELLVICEDIGRHNTIDKVAGRMMLDDIQAKRKILITSGRVSSEMQQKAARLGAAILISRTSPTTLSIEMADQYGITLIGYTRDRQFNVYTHPERIDFSPLEVANESARQTGSPSIKIARRKHK